MIEKVLQNCGKCGVCLSVCPVYEHLKEEQVSPRAKLQLIKAYENDKLTSSPLLKEIVSKCLMCGSCAANCPSGINHYSKFMEMRKKMVQEMGETAAIRTMIYLLARETRIKIGAGLARTGQKLIPDTIAKTFKMGNIPLKRFPKMNAIPFRQTHGTLLMPDKDPVGTVMYFTGCATNYLYEDTGTAVIDILKHMGYKVLIPNDQTCCSIPLLFHGSDDSALKNIVTNINSLKSPDVDAILVDCSTCGEALKNEYPMIFDDGTPENAAANIIASRVMHVLPFINQHLDLLEMVESPDQRTLVTYHAPCHTKNDARSHEIIETLLNKLPTVSYKKTFDTEACCGGGGTFFYEYPEISKKMADRKIEHARATKASLWLTDCPVCRINLAGNLDDNDRLQVLHPVTLIKAALKRI